MGSGFFFGAGMTHTWATRGAAVGYCAAPGPGMAGAERTKDWNCGVNCPGATGAVLGAAGRAEGRASPEPRSSEGAKRLGATEDADPDGNLGGV